MSFHIERAGPEHVDTITEHRRSMFSDMGHRNAAALDEMSASFRPWVAERLRSGEYLAWFVVVEGRVAAGAGLWLMDWPPHLIGPGSRRGNILNVYTRPEFRRQGMARALVETAVAWCRANRIGCVILHASADGRGLYESLGFRTTNEMRMEL